MLIEQNFELKEIDFHSTISVLPQKIPVSKFLMTSLHVICGFAPPPLIKNPGYANDSEILV